jgi:outer membrane biosynthesis protein TonB
MTSILALAAIGSWTYAGFLAEPTSTLPTPTPPPAPTRPADVEPKVEPASNPAPEPEEESEEEPEPEQKPEAPAVPTATLPTRYRLADAGGQVWEHADPVYLRSFVEARNRSFVQQRYYQPLRARSARCANGRCN